MQATGVLLKNLRRTGRTNLAIAFPEKSEEEREPILDGTFENLGRRARGA